MIRHASLQSVRLSSAHLQPFDYLKTLVTGGPEELPEKEEIPKPPAANSGENLKHDEKMQEGEESEEGEAGGKDDSEDKGE